MARGASYNPPQPRSRPLPAAAAPAGDLNGPGRSGTACCRRNEGDGSCSTARCRASPWSRPCWAFPPAPWRRIRRGRSRCCARPCRACRAARPRRVAGDALPRPDPLSRRGVRPRVAMVAAAGPAWHRRAPMLSIPASRPNAYSGSPLDRAANRREDSAFIDAALADPETLFAPVWRSRSLMKGVADGPAGGGAADRRRGRGAAHGRRPLGLPRPVGGPAGLRGGLLRGGGPAAAAAGGAWAPSPTSAPSPGCCRRARPASSPMPAG